MYYWYLNFLVSVLATLTTRTAIPEFIDFAVQPLGRPGSPLSPKRTTMFLHLVQLEIYRETLARGMIVSHTEWKREWNGITFIFRPHAGITSDWGDALFGLQSILVAMLNPEQPIEFRQSTWEVGRRRPETSWRTLTPVATILIGHTPRVLSRDDPASIPSPASKASAPTSGPLSAPFVVPDTQMTLLFSSGGVKLIELAIIMALDEMIGRAWRNVAINRRAQPIMRGEASEITAAHTICWMLVRPRMESVTSLLTEIDVVEASVGIVYYMVQNGFYATKITAVRPNSSGKRIVVGEIEFSINRPSVHGPTFGNSSLIQAV